MTILLYKNGQWLIDGEQPLEGVSLDNLAAILTNPSDGDVIKYDEASGLWISGKADALPPVTPADNGKVLTVKDGAWAAVNNDIVLNATWSDTYPLMNITTSPLPSMAEVQKCFETGGKVFLHIGVTTIVALSGVEKSNDTQFDYYCFTGRGVDYDGNIKIFYVVLYDDDGVTSYHAYAIDDRKFTVTITPTSPDYSGTMDKTVAEINAAYEAGQEIWFSVAVSGQTYSFPMGAVYKHPDFTYPSFNSNVVIGDGGDMLLWTFTGATNTGTKDTYGTTIYSLTPAS